MGAEPFAIPELQSFAIGDERKRIMPMSELKDGDTIFTWDREEGFKFHPSLNAAERFSSVFNYQIGRKGYTFTTPNDDRRPHISYEESLTLGRNYMVGNHVPLRSFRKSHRTYIKKDHWLQFAVEAAFENPDSKIHVVLPRFEYEINARGDGSFVEIRLPHHGKGGEKSWIVHCTNKRSKILVDVD